jgi:hypothetical protein
MIVPLFLNKPNWNNEIRRRPCLPGREGAHFALGLPPRSTGNSRNFGPYAILTRLIDAKQLYRHGNPNFRNSRYAG